LGLADTEPEQLLFATLEDYGCHYIVEQQNKFFSILCMEAIFKKGKKKNKFASSAFDELPVSKNELILANIWKQPIFPKLKMKSSAL